MSTAESGRNAPQKSNALHTTLARYGWEIRPDLHEAGMSKHDEARERGELISRSMADHFAVFSHPQTGGYIEVAGENQFWWVPALSYSGEPEDYGETAEELVAFLESMPEKGKRGRG